MADLALLPSCRRLRPLVPRRRRSTETGNRCGAWKDLADGKEHRPRDPDREAKHRAGRHAAPGAPPRGQGAGPRKERHREPDAGEAAWPGREREGPGAPGARESWRQAAGHHNLLARDRDRPTAIGTATTTCWPGTAIKPDRTDRDQDRPERRGQVCVSVEATQPPGLLLWFF